MKPTTHTCPPLRNGINIRIERMNFLRQQINDLEYFITTTDVASRIPIQTKSRIVQTVEIKRTYKVLGFRFFGVGKHESTIDVPAVMIADLCVSAKNLKIKFETELNQLVP